MFETFSQRKKKLALGDAPEVYTYDQIPSQLRHQICMVMHESIGPYKIINIYSSYVPPNANDLWEQIDKICQKEIYPYLRFRHEEYLDKRFFDFLLQCEEIDELLSAIEIGCVGLAVLSGQSAHRGATTSGEAALEEINARFRPHGVGYRAENKHLIRVDAEYSHSEIIKPALKILSSERLSAVNDEFMIAHKHYRNGSYSDSVTAANRAFESMLKFICDFRKWPYKKGDRASDLITIVISNSNLPFDKSFGAYVAMLKSGLPNIRNEAGAHGQGANSVESTANVAQYALNMAASNIIFLNQIL